MLLLLSVLPALAADPAFRPPVVPTPQPAEVAPSPYESQLVVPAIDVPTRVALESNLRISLPELTQAAAASHALALQLEADPRWRVVDWDGARVAYQRVVDGKEWSVPLRGYNAAADGVWRLAIVLSPWGPNATWATSPLVGHAAADAGMLELSQITYVGNPEWRAVAWEWGDPGATLEVFEAGPSAQIETFPRTNDALSTVPHLMGRIAGAAAEIEAKGFAASLMPARSVRTGEPTMALTSPGAGELDLRAWVRTPGPGVTWARILDTDLSPWEEAAVAAGTREILGSSHDEKQLFYMQSRFPVPGGAAFSGTVEIWHQPDGGGEVKRIAAFPITVPAR